MAAPQFAASCDTSTVSQLAAPYATATAKSVKLALEHKVGYADNIPIVPTSRIMYRPVPAN